MDGANCGVPEGLLPEDSEPNGLITNLGAGEYQPVQPLKNAVLGVSRIPLQNIVF